MEVTITPGGAAPMDAITATDGNVRHTGRVSYFGELAFVAIDDEGNSGGSLPQSMRQAIAKKLKDEHHNTAVFCPETACWQMHIAASGITRSFGQDVANRVLFAIVGFVAATILYLI